MVDRYGFRPDLISNTNIRPNQNATTQLSYPSNPGGQQHHGGHHRPPFNPVRPPQNTGPTQNRYYWCHWSVGQAVPHNAVRGGTDCDGTAIYVGRGFHNGDQIPAKVIPEKSAVYVAWGGDEIFLHECELLCQQQFSWVHASNGEVPYGAIVAGHTSSGEPLYVARTYHEGSHCIGKLHPSHGSCYVPFGGKEHAHSHYEVLVLRD